MIKCDVKRGLDSGECNKNNIYNIYNKIIMISKNDSSKLSLSHNKTYLNQVSKNNQIVLK